MEQLLEGSALGDACCRTSSTPPVHKPTFITYQIQNVCIVQLPLLYCNHLCSSYSTLLLHHLLLRLLERLCFCHGEVTLAGPLVNFWA